MTNSNQIKLPYGVAQQLENLRGAIRGATAALATGNLEAWEVREFEAVKNECTARLLEWEASIAEQCRPVGMNQPTASEP